jgi:isocitrate lyase
MYPDLSLYPSNSVPQLVRKINAALRRADQIQSSDGKKGPYWYAPIVADGEAGFGGNLNVFEITKWMVEAGAAGVHFEDQLSSAKKCGHMGGKVLEPTRSMVDKLVAARLASDVVNVPIVIIARTDADAAKLITSDFDERDKPFIAGKRTPEGFFGLKGGIDCAIARGRAYAPYCDLIWCETSHPDLDEAARFAEGIHEVAPGKMLAYNCSPSFNWKKKLGADTIASFRNELAAMGYKFQFITLAGFHSLNHSMFKLAWDYRERGMSAYADFQGAEFDCEPLGYQATAHQKFVGTSYFDEVAQIIGGSDISTAAMKGSTEEAQF